MKTSIMVSQKVVSLYKDSSLNRI